MSTAIITLAGLDAPLVALSPDAIKARTDALMEAATVTEITDVIDRDMCDTAMRRMDGLMKSVERARTEIKGPVLDIGRKIDGIAKDFTGPIKTEYERLSRLAGAYDLACRERDRIAREEAQRKAEEARRAEIEALREKELKAIEEAERLRKASEAAALTNPAEAENLKLLARAKEEAAAKRLAEEARALDAEIRAEVAITAPRETQASVAVRGVWEYEITNAYALFRVHPECFKLEPVKSAISSALDLANGQLPGISNATKVFKTQLR
ncbi:MAG: hypothetical protein WC378_18190 [Opitutaceae bacterium]|jgi:hypothetical protein